MTPTFHPQPTSRAYSGRTSAVDVAHLRAVVQGVVGRLLGSGDPDYEDVVQTSFERVLGTLETVSARGASLGAWAAAIARNVSVDALRSRSRERKILSRDDDAAIANRPTSIDPERLACARERLARFAFDLGRLRTGVAEVVYMHDVLECDLSEVAGVLEISVAAAQSRLVRGRRRLPGADCSRPWHRPSRRPTASHPIGHLLPAAGAAVRLS